MTGFGAVAAIDKPLTAGQWPQLRETEIEQLDATFVTMMFPGLRSRCTMPARCALSSASATSDCRLQRLLELERPASQAVRERLTLEVFEHEVVGAALMAHVIQRADVLMLETGDGLASRSNRALRSGSAEGRILIATVRSRRVSFAL